MALPAACLSEDQFTCSICLEVFKNPVSTPCGHSFCKPCINSYWNGGERGRGAKFYQCPLCKESFRKRPELHINRTLKEITEQFQLMASLPADARVGGVEHPHHHHHHPQSVQSAPSRPGEMPESLLAEMITRFQQLAAPGMLGATPSHPSDPQTLNPDVAFQTQNPPHSLPLCPVHLRGLEFFCRTDNTCICCICVETAEHRGHAVVPAHREWQISKSHLGIAEVELKDLICERQRKVEEIHISVQEIKAAAEQETHLVVSAFSKLISSVEVCQAEVMEVINMSVQAAELRAQSLLREVEEEIAALQERRTTLSQLASTEDYVLFLKAFPALSTPPQTKDWSSVSVRSQQTPVFKTVNQMMEGLQEEISKLPELCRRSSSTQSAPRPKTKAPRVEEYAADITLDPSTAHPRLLISPDGKMVKCGERHQLVSDKPQRFDRVVCVMAHQGFSSGRHYWEVEVGGKTDWDLGIASRSVNRKGKITVSPAHGYWFLSLRDGTDYAFRTEPSINLMVNVRPSRIGVFVDCDKGQVSFYNAEARILIYSFYSDRFPDTIHPFFSPCTNKSGQNEAPLIICPVSVTE
ncbi:E3 ubiquitin-protein ligase TRIM39 isoform X2 [Melanotaenia boesemani]|uniref:E3 ubiquitin-protein ligase TRIM39 isoform X2 n=1 Tax=Melanotaenia boesemani TaxID=1250792 RepID=UPI001C05DE6F|nr:E3 ubiquitin-protein ligase TRIM39 isoform X2 [Melanotaenia boesemani]